MQSGRNLLKFKANGGAIGLVVAVTSVEIGSRAFFAKAPGAAVRDYRQFKCVASHAKIGHRWPGVGDPGRWPPDMTCHFPTRRGWLLFGMAFVGSFLIRWGTPVISSLGDWQTTSFIFVTRVVGVVLFMACVAGFVDVLRRGPNADRLLALLSAWFIYLLAYATSKAFFYTIVA